jgi:nitroimidazol reductase NimA-like FMN-containing flavoprotein (pyridoxamine 5'-phosphate oxidase superfamily)
MNQLTPQEIAEVIAGAKFAHIAVISGDEPYVTPISFVSIGDGIAFRSLTGKRLDALAANPHVSIEITEYIEETGSWRCVIAQGHAVVVEDVNEEALIIQSLLHRYEQNFSSLLGDTGPSFSKAFVIKVEFDGITGRSSGTFLQPKTRPGRL